MRGKVLNKLTYLHISVNMFNNTNLGENWQESRPCQAITTKVNFTHEHGRDHPRTAQADTGAARHDSKSSPGIGRPRRVAFPAGSCRGHVPGHGPKGVICIPPLNVSVA